jgi:hypothetical protein
MSGLLSPEAVRRLAAVRVGRFDRTGSRAPRETRDIEQAREAVRARWGDDLCGLLNAMSRDELADLAGVLRVPAGAGSRSTARGSRQAAAPTRAGTARSPALREALWSWGAQLERNGAEIAPSLQPRPILLGGHLVVQARPRGMSPACKVWPRAVPPPIPASPPDEEPETLDDLLAAADRLIGVRLGPRGRDKGAWGLRAARLLGIVERGLDEPDWRGDVEVKTVPVAQQANGCWGIVEDPAIAMVGDGQGRGSVAKLQRTLWLARATVPGDAAPDATIVSWYLLDWDDEVSRLARRYLHERPKGPAGTHGRGLYLYKRFFADAGMLATLNGWP